MSHVINTGQITLSAKYWGHPTVVDEYIGKNLLQDTFTVNVDIKA